MAGSIPLSLTQRFDNVTHEPLDGGFLYFIKAGTTSTPQNAFQDINLTIPWPNPMQLDAGGNIPQLFFADGLIKIRLTNRAGVQQIVADNIQVVGPSSGGGGGGTVDPTTIFQTGYLVSRYGTGTVAGFVRLNGKTIGNATSGGTERANADCQPLFEYLWNNDPNLDVPGGRGVSAFADWTTGHQIALPDGRGRVLAGLDDMGSGAAGRLTATYFGASGTTLGARGGVESNTLDIAKIPAIGSTGSHNLTVYAGGDPANRVPFTKGNVGGSIIAASGSQNVPISSASDWSQATAFTGTLAVSVASQGTGGQAHANVQPTLLVTNYIKL